MSSRSTRRRQAMGILKIGDWFVIVAVVVATAVLLVISGGSSTSGAAVYVESSSGRDGPFELAARDTISCAGPLGTTTIEIAAHRARIAASPCRHQICVRTGWISRAGEIAACVPNGVVIRLAGPARAAGGLDAVTQ